MRAYSGREALRSVMEQEFAVILLDVNMPGMDGFETASLIRQRKNSEHVPIIFITAYGDDDHRTRGYSLGAVDYIQTPVVPEVLKTKVSVFVDLFRKTEQVRRQAHWLHHRATQLHKLTEACLAINSAMSMDRILHTMTETARDIIGACGVGDFSCEGVTGRIRRSWRRLRTGMRVGAGAGRGRGTTACRRRCARRTRRCAYPGGDAGAWELAEIGRSEWIGWADQGLAGGPTHRSRRAQHGDDRGVRAL